MKLNQPRVRIGRALAAVGVSAMLAGGALATPAGASPGLVQPSKPAQRAVVHQPNLAVFRARLLRLVDSRPSGRLPKLVVRQRQLRQRDGRPGVRLPERSARVADVLQFDTFLSPANTLGLDVDVAGGSTSPDAGVIDWWPKATDNANQDWTFENITPSEPNLFFIVNDNSGLCLTTNGAAGEQVYQEPCGGPGVNVYGQIWNTGLRPNTWPDAWAIQSYGSGLFLDVYGGSPWPGAYMDTWYANGGANQFFYAYS
jgi:hypothetical protein